MDQDLRTDIAKAHDRICDELSAMRETVKQQKSIIEDRILDEQISYFEKSREMFEKSWMTGEEDIFERHKYNNAFDDEKVWGLFTGRLGLYNNWQKPALQIHPLFGQVTDFIKGNDPLYIMDITDKMLFYVKTLWTEQYQRRLRYYTFNQSDDKPFNELPYNQFGLVIAVNYYDYIPIGTIKTHMEDIFNLLCPGGVTIFTYNNCSIPEGVEKVEKNYKSYVPKELLEQLLVETGYQIIKHVDAYGLVYWVEAKKPGEIESIRGGQTLAEICSF